MLIRSETSQIHTAELTAKANLQWGQTNNITDHLRSLITQTFIDEINMWRFDQIKHLRCVSVIDMLLFLFVSFSLPCSRDYNLCALIK